VTFLLISSGFFVGKVFQAVDKMMVAVALIVGICFVFIRPLAVLRHFLLSQKVIVFSPSVSA